MDRKIIFFGREPGNRNHPREQHPKHQTPSPTLNLSPDLSPDEVRKRLLVPLPHPSRLLRSRGAR